MFLTILKEAELPSQSQKNRLWCVLISVHLTIFAKQQQQRGPHSIGSLFVSALHFLAFLVILNQWKCSHGRKRNWVKPPTSVWLGQPRYHLSSATIKKWLQAYVKACPKMYRSSETSELFWIEVVFLNKQKKTVEIGIKQLLVSKGKFFFPWKITRVTKEQTIHHCNKPNVFLKNE